MGVGVEILLKGYVPALIRGLNDLGIPLQSERCVLVNTSVSTCQMPQWKSR